MKFRVQRIVLLVGILLLAGKFIAFWLTNSVGILTDALESIVNVAAGAFSLWGIWLAGQPRDKGHPFGHGKIELLTASVEGILIIMAGGLVIYQGIVRIITPAMPERLDIGILIIGIAGVVNWLLGRWSIFIGRRNNSIALIAGGRHLQSDTYSTIGLLLGLGLLLITGIAWIDGALALLFGGVIVVTGIGILRHTVANLLDASDNTIIELIANKLESARGVDWVDVHELRVVSYGDCLHIDCHLTLPSFYDIGRAHQRADAFEAVISETVAPRTALISVHIDPCDSRMCAGCLAIDCPIRSFALFEFSPLTAGSVVRDDYQRSLVLDNLPERHNGNSAQQTP